jgi:hypothetical protein
VSNRSPDLIHHYFDAFPGFALYPDVEETLDRLKRRFRLAIVSNIDDDLLDSTPLPKVFDLVCTAERARGYKTGWDVLSLPSRKCSRGERSVTTFWPVAIHGHGGC